MCACGRVRVCVCVHMCACAGVWERGYAGLCGVSVWHVISLRTKPSRVGSMDRISSQFYNARRWPRPRRCIQGGVLALGAQQGGSCVHIRFSVRACAAQMASSVPCLNVIHCRGEQHTLKDLQTLQQSNTPHKVQSRTRAGVSLTMRCCAQEVSEMWRKVSEEAYPQGL